MTKLFGFTRSNVCGNVVGIGQRCICWNIYWAKAKKRFGGWFYVLNSDKVVEHLHTNQKAFKFLGYVRINNEEILRLSDD